MKKKITTITIITIAILMACHLLSSCSMGVGDNRDRNLEQSVLAHLNSVPNVEYVGLSDVSKSGDDNFKAVVIYYVTDSVGNKHERNARVTTNDDCSTIYTWEDLDSNILGDTKQMVSDKLEEKGINMDSSLIDALIELKKRLR